MWGPKVGGGEGGRGLGEGRGDTYPPGRFDQCQAQAMPCKHAVSVLDSYIVGFCSEGLGALIHTGCAKHKSHMQHSSTTIRKHQCGFTSRLLDSPLWVHHV